MNSPKDEATALFDALVAEHGPNFDIDSFTADPDAEAVEVPRLETPNELVMTKTVSLALSWPAWQRLEARAAAAGMGIDELVSEWVSVEASAQDSVPRDAILHMLGHHQRRSA